MAEGEWCVGERCTVLFAVSVTARYLAVLRYVEKYFFPLGGYSTGLCNP